MDQQEMIVGEGWTEERHAAFLNWMEESFVHRMLSPKRQEAAAGFCPIQQCSPAACRDLPLNRLIPDSATESTGDSRPRPSRLLVESGRVHLFDKPKKWFKIVSLLRLDKFLSFDLLYEIRRNATIFWILVKRLVWYIWLESRWWSANSEMNQFMVINDDYDDDN
jgi:hypothetical protein